MYGHLNAIKESVWWKCYQMSRFRFFSSPLHCFSISSFLRFVFVFCLKLDSINKLPTHTSLWCAVCMPIWSVCIYAVCMRNKGRSNTHTICSTPLDTHFQGNRGSCACWTLNSMQVCIDLVWEDDADCVLLGNNCSILLQNTTHSDSTCLYGRDRKKSISNIFSIFCVFLLTRVSID